MSAAKSAGVSWRSALLNNLADWHLSARMECPLVQRHEKFFAFDEKQAFLRSERGRKEGEAQFKTNRRPRSGAGAGRKTGQSDFERTE